MQIKISIITSRHGVIMKIMKYDMTVAGAGLAGICAAVAGARKGLRTLLINDRSVLGGNASSEIGITISGASHHGLNTSVYAKEGGIMEEIRLRLAKYARGGGYGTYALLDAVFFDLIYEHTNITLLLNTSVYACDIKERKITKCYARHSISNEVYEIESSIYIDATGNGVLAYEAGCDYRMGREGKEEYGEAFAPEKADTYTMGNTFYFETRDCGYPVSYTPPAFAHKVENMDFIKNINNPKNFRNISIKGAHWSFEYGGQVDVIYQSEEVDLELRKLIYGIWDYVKNSGKYPEAEHYILKRIYAKSGARESRRFMGDYILNENDIENKVNFWDSVCIGGWPMDIHAPLGIYDFEPATNFVPVTGIYNIPMRSLYAKNIDNLMFAGRNISASHIALGSTRVMATCGAMGQAVGTAAKYCISKNITPKEMTKLYIKELQKDLAYDDQTIIGIESISPVMKNFTATATSEKIFENTNCLGVMKLDRDYGLAIMVRTESLESVKIKINNESDHKTKLQYKILTGRHKETFLPEQMITRKEVLVPGNYTGWITLSVNTCKGEDSKLYLVFEKNENLSLGIGEDRPIGAVTLRFYKPDESRISKECNHDSVPVSEAVGYSFLDHRYERKRNILFKDMIPSQRLFSPEMVLSPYTRPYEIPNIWIGDNSYPNTLTLSAKSAVNARYLAITFDSDLENDSINHMPSSLVKDYSVTIYCEDGVIRKSVQDNWKRHAVFEINAALIEKIEVTVESSWGAASGIYGVNLF